MPGIAQPGIPGRPRFTTGRPACDTNANRTAFHVDNNTERHNLDAKAICRPCPVRAECLAWVVEHPQPYGVFAGLTAPERDKLGAVTDPAKMVERLRGGEALRAARQVSQATLKRAAAVRAVGVNDLDRAQLILRHAPRLAAAVTAGAMTLVEAAYLADPDTRSAAA